MGLTPEKNDFITFDNGTKSYIRTASGELITVEGPGVIDYTPTQELSICSYFGWDYRSGRHGNQTGRRTDLFR